VIPDFDPRSYPGPRPPGPVVVHDGVVHPLIVDGPVDAPFRPDGETTADAGRGRSIPVLANPRDRRWSVAYGSNASPGRLVAKALDRDGAVLLPARVAGFAPAFENRRTGYGSVPLTLVPSPGTVHDTWVLGVRADATPHLDRTEGRVPAGAQPSSVPEPADGRFAPPGSYQLARVGAVAVADRFVLPGAFAYLPGTATRVQVTGSGSWRTWPRFDQAEAAAHVEASGPDRPAPDAMGTVPGRWPATPLADLPLFVYGTLRPDGPAWRRIADLVRVIGPATTAGMLNDTGHGWPAASFAPRGPGTRALERVRGTLVAATGHRQARALFERADAYEGAPDLFVRTTVLVEGPTGLSWAASYAWARGRLPGAAIPGGKWVVR
jgi:gamma-glutamylcyclotransferase (GGCT)/AIG2-like uncharacterized protein YtfP